MQVSVSLHRHQHWQFSAILWLFFIAFHYADCFPGGCEVTFYCGFDLHFILTNNVELRLSLGVIASQIYNHRQFIYHSP